MNNDLSVRLARCTVASCRCMTKTPEVQYHDKSCLYRVLNEAIEVIDALQTGAGGRDGSFEHWFATRFSAPEAASLKPLIQQTWNAAIESLTAKVAAVALEPQSPPAFHAAIVRNSESQS